jgi:hypothetical protein
MNRKDWLERMDVTDIALIIGIIILGLTNSYGAGWLIFILIIRNS